MVIIIIFVLSIFLTVKIGNIVFHNTYGSIGAYIRHYFWIFMIILFILAGICNKIGLL